MTLKSERNICLYFLMIFILRTSKSKSNAGFAVFFVVKAVLLRYNVFMEFYSFRGAHLLLSVTRNYGSF